MKLELWTRPNNYLGQTWEDYYVFLSQHRDSDTLDRSNFICALEQVGKEHCAIAHERHWACGWIETIMIHKEDAEGLAKAEAILKKLEDYPVIDEEHYSELEYLENPEEIED